jgi:hypothetical protein
MKDMGAGNVKCLNTKHANAASQQQQQQQQQKEKE